MNDVWTCDVCGGPHKTGNCKGIEHYKKAAAQKRAETQSEAEAQSTAKRKAAADKREGGKARRRLNVAEPQEGQQFSSVPPDFYKEMAKALHGSTPATPATGDLPPLPPGEQPRTRTSFGNRDLPDNANRSTNRSTNRG